MYRLDLVETETGRRRSTNARRITRREIDAYADRLARELGGRYAVEVVDEAMAEDVLVKVIEEVTDPVVRWLRNEHAGADHDEPYPSGDGEGAA